MLLYNRFWDDSVTQLYSGCTDEDIQVSHLILSEYKINATAVTLPCILQASALGPLWVEKFQAVLSQKLNELRQCYHIQEVKGTLEILNFLYRCACLLAPCSILYTS